MRHILQDTWTPSQQHCHSSGIFFRLRSEPEPCVMFDDFLFSGDGLKLDSVLCGEGETEVWFGGGISNLIKGGFMESKDVISKRLSALFCFNCLHMDRFFGNDFRPWFDSHLGKRWTCYCCCRPEEKNLDEGRMNQPCSHVVTGNRLSREAVDTSGKL